MNRKDEKTKDPAQSPWVGSPVGTTKMRELRNEFYEEMVIAAFNLGNELGFNAGVSARVSRSGDGFGACLHRPSNGYISQLHEARLGELLNAVQSEDARKENPHSTAN